MKWRTAQGVAINITKMSDDHLINAIMLMHEKFPFRVEQLPFLVAEASRRELAIPEDVLPLAKDIAKVIIEWTNAGFTMKQLIGGKFLQSQNMFDEITLWAPIRKIEYPDQKSEKIIVFKNPRRRILKRRKTRVSHR